MQYQVPLYCAFDYHFSCVTVPNNIKLSLQIQQLDCVVRFFYRLQCDKTGLNHATGELG
jgi:hypothetical protein